MKTVLLVIVTLVLGEVRGQLQQSGPCPVVPFVRKFDLAKMMGVWYEQIHTQRWSDLELACNTHKFYPSSNSTFTYHTFARNPASGGQYHKVGNVTARMRVSGLALDVSEGVGESYDVIVVDTDYVSFATLWTCMPGQTSHFENVVVLTREKFPGLSALLSALDALDARNITRMYLIYTEQRDCPAFTTNPAPSLNTTQAATFTSPSGVTTTLTPPVQVTTAVPNNSNPSSSTSGNADVATTTAPPISDVPSTSVFVGVVTVPISSTPGPSPQPSTGVVVTTDHGPDAGNTSPASQPSPPGSDSPISSVSVPTQGSLTSTPSGQSAGSTIGQGQSAGTTLDQGQSGGSTPGHGPGDTTAGYGNPTGLTTATYGATTQAPVKGAAGNNHQTAAMIGVTSLLLVICNFLS